MRIEADFQAISTEFKSLPAGVYPRMRIADIEVKETRENKLPMLVFQLEVTEDITVDGELVPAGRTINDFVTLKTKEGKRNDVGLGRLKAYAIAVVGEEKANGSGVETDELKDGLCSIEVKHEPYNDNGTQKTSAKVAKVLPVG